MTLTGKSGQYDPGCKKCKRLADYLKEIRELYPDYHSAPVAPFGSSSPALLIVGLAPGLHGANASGRPFTGDYAGIILYQMLHEYGFSNKPVSSHRKDGLKLKNCRITNAVKCLPPANKPSGEEIRTCNGYLANEIQSNKGKLLILALGRIAHDAVLRAHGLKMRDYPFSHGALHCLPGGNRQLLDSYHCSRYNTNTGRLTESMFRSIFDKIHKVINITD